MQGQMASNDTHKQQTKQRVAIGLKLYDAVEPSITMNPKTLEPQEPNPEPKLHTLDGPKPQAQNPKRNGTCGSAHSAIEG